MFFKNRRFPPIWGSKEESMACALRRDRVSDSGFSVIGYKKEKVGQRTCPGLRLLDLN
ncbi:MAG: hypothetical protein P8X74_07395 [Reinekea sp.]